MSLLLPTISIAQIDGRRASPWRDTGGLEYLNVDLAPQNAALGNAGIANPSGGFLQNSALLMSQKDKLGVSLQYSPWLRALGIREFHFAAGRASFQLDKRRSIGLSYQQFSSLLTEWFFDPVLPFHQVAARLHYAQKQNKFNWGLSLGYVRAGLGAYRGENRKSTGITISGGLTSHTYQFWGADWVFAASFRDWGPRQLVRADSSIIRIRYSYLPTTFAIGGQTSIQQSNTRFNIHYQLEHLLVPRDLDDINSGWLAPIQSIQDAPQGGNWKDWQLRLGLEWTEIALGKRLALALRLGYQYEAPELGNRHLLSTGLGISSKHFDLDASYWQPLVPNQALQNTFMFGIGYRWSPD